jgi:cytochrome c oxidase assembly protein subunit 11
MTAGTEATPTVAAQASRSRRRNRKTAIVVGGIAFGMVGMAFAAVPLYEIFCRVTGYGGTTQRVDAAPGEVLDRMVTVHFDANTAPDLGWTFGPAQRSVEVRLGEPTVIEYVATNLTDRPTAGTAVFNVTPENVGAYFDKIQCFCFTSQVLAPGETARFPVMFFVDPDLADNTLLDYIQTITLSYTFYPAPLPEQRPVAQVGPAGGG